MPSPRRVKILLLIPHLGGGGAERVIATLARNLDPSRYEVHLALVTQSSRPSLPPGLLVHPLGARRVRYGALSLLRLVWLLRPDLILSGIAHLNLLALALRPFFPSRASLCVRQNGALPATLAAGGHPLLARRLYATAYRCADRIICQTNSMASELQAELAIDPAKLVVLPNPVDIDAIRATARKLHTQPPPGPRLLAVARLAPEKGIDLLLQAFAAVHRDLPHAHLEILGAGPSRAALEEQRNALALEECVQFHGEVAFPAEHFSHVSVFVLSSRHEGLPNALLEAAAAGLPIVALPASAGLAALLREQPGIWLASEISAPALERALRDALISVQPRQRFRHTWIDAFAQNKAISAYEGMMEAVLLERKS
ncbi:MAG TPA: glycosyltransferase [Terracidiphilus sp.]|nr:glycosyltransferase [Terracidiphilus sp.]